MLEASITLSYSSNIRSKVVVCSQCGALVDLDFKDKEEWLDCKEEGEENQK
jgi:hypothetical protein